MGPLKALGGTLDSPSAAQPLHSSLKLLVIKADHSKSHGGPSISSPRIYVWAINDRMCKIGPMTIYIYTVLVR